KNSLYSDMKPILRRSQKRRADRIAHKTHKTSKRHCTLKLFLIKGRFPNFSFFQETFPTRLQRRVKLASTEKLARPLQTETQIHYFPQQSYKTQKSIDESIEFSV
ncbi:MAG: hypothetical protein IJU03_05930, partial [Thermoguttaceae bacterium]|nr:hypothetical protein [Thermoguttaceae bacterium]